MAAQATAALDTMDDTNLPRGSEGVGVLIDPSRLIDTQTPKNRQNPYYLVIGGMRFYGPSPDRLVQMLKTVPVDQINSKIKQPPKSAITRFRNSAKSTLGRFRNRAGQLYKGTKSRAGNLYRGTTRRIGNASKLMSRKRGSVKSASTVVRNPSDPYAAQGAIRPPERISNVA